MAHRTVSRRALLRAGGLGGFGLTLAGALEAEAVGAGPIRSCILIFFYGGPSHLETWDPKPDAPAEVRGEWAPIPTAAPGVRISESLAQTAREMRHVALIRSMTHPMRNHNSAAVEALCGRTPLGGDQELLADDSLSFPCYGSVLSYALRGLRHPLPHVALPHTMRNVVRLPGQTAGFLGPRFERYQVESDPNSAGFTPGELALPAGLSPHRLAHRESLLRLVDAQLARSEAQLGRGAAPPLERAFALLRSDGVRRAFDLGREAESTRERYGRHTLGQSALLARRLVEAGVRFVTVFDGVHNGQEANWDSHERLFPRHRQLLGPADQALSALIGDLHARGLLESTLVVAMGEFGRTPKINGSAGRDHWPDCFSIALAGGGVRGGTVYGASDETGAYPAANPVRPGDLAATLYHRFGVDPTAEMRDTVDRPYPFAEGRPLTALF